jgi:NAD(P)-dependent dehydrogenase (short-subunit alcohol dehydrogenase family)
MNLTNQTAIISGGLGDIGRAIALELAVQGADVALGDILEDNHAADVLGEIRSLGRRSRYDRVDISDAGAVQAWINAVEGELGTTTLIIPNAAIVHFMPLPKLTPEHWRKELSVNLDGAFYLAQAASMRLVERKKPGRIVFIGSWAGHAVHPTIPTYCVSKAGLRMLMKCMAAELSPHNILVNEVAPGYVNAGLSGRWFAEHPDSAEKARLTVPARRLIEPAEVARQVGWLCDPANQHLTGTTLVMDGGLSLFGFGGQKEEL